MVTANKNDKVVTLLLEHSADVNVVDKVRAYTGPYVLFLFLLYVVLLS